MSDEPEILLPALRQYRHNSLNGETTPASILTGFDYYKTIEIVDSLTARVAELEQNAAFYKSCALSGEVPEEGSEPCPPQPDMKG